MLKDSKKYAGRAEPEIDAEIDPIGLHRKPGWSRNRPTPDGNNSPIFYSFNFLT
jgi:hypothetical protein